MKNLSLRLGVVAMSLAHAGGAFGQNQNPNQAPQPTQNLHPQVQQQALPQQFKGQGRFSQARDASVPIDRKNIEPIDTRHLQPDESLIQLALLLDTSNSMDGLIAQAKEQLWMIVNELAKAHKGGKPARLEVALFEYGNDKLRSTDGFIRLVQPFTHDLDLVSEHLFALATDGGKEYCGHVLKSAVNRLLWNPAPQSLKITYVAGNEAFDQGAIDYRGAAKQARDRAILVNTIFCGDDEEGKRTLWLAGAKIGGGAYMNIDQDQARLHIDAPQDDELLRLNNELNRTYVPYGADREVYVARQAAQDTNAMRVNKGVAAKRAVSKGSRMYSNESWDLVDAFDKKTIAPHELKDEHLPPELRGKNSAQIQAYVADKKQKRQAIKKRIGELSQKRQVYVADRRRQLAAEKGNSLQDAIINSLHEQAEARGFAFSNP